MRFCDGSRSRDRKKRMFFFVRNWLTFSATFPWAKLTTAFLSTFTDWSSWGITVTCIAACAPVNYCSLATYMGVGRGGARRPWILKFSEKRVLLVPSGKNQIPPLLAPPLEKFRKNPLAPPHLEKIHPTPVATYISNQCSFIRNMLAA